MLRKRLVTFWERSQNSATNGSRYPDGDGPRDSGWSSVNPTCCIRSRKRTTTGCESNCKVKENALRLSISLHLERRANEWPTSVGSPLGRRNVGEGVWR